MRLKCTPDFGHQVMEQVLQGLDDIEVNLDDIGTISKQLEEYIVLLDKTTLMLKDSM